MSDLSRRDLLTAAGTLAAGGLGPGVAAATGTSASDVPTLSPSPIRATRSTSPERTT
jgi:hypothetical protein